MAYEYETLLVPTWTVRYFMYGETEGLSGEQLEAINLANEFYKVNGLKFVCFESFEVSPYHTDFLCFLEDLYPAIFVREVKDAA